MNSIALNGASRVVFIVGDPIAQVKSPEGMTRYFQDTLKEDIIVLPAHVESDGFSAFIDGAISMKNCLGVIATIPHKVRLLDHCRRSSDSAKTIGAANIARIESGELFGDQVDGQGMLAAVTAKGIQVERKNALLLGAGGAGCAIVYTLLKAGVHHLTIQDCEPHKADQLIERLSAAFPDRSIGNDFAGTPEILINATPLGMNDTDPVPFDHNIIGKSETVLDVVTGTRDTDLIGLAKCMGLNTVSGNEMFQGLRRPMADFLLARKF